MLSRCFHLYLKTKHISVISLVMLSHYRAAVVYKVVQSLTDSFIDNFFCIDCLGMIEHTLSPYNNKFEKWGLTNYLGWIFLKFLWISCHVMAFKINNINSTPYILQCSCAILFVKSILLLKSGWCFWKYISENFLRKPMLLHYMTKTTFRMVNKQYHRLLKYRKIWFQEMYMTNFCLVGMTKDILNQSLNRSIFWSNNVLTNFNIHT